MAKENCDRSSTVLTWDESAAIYLYSMPITFFSCLNERLRAGNRDVLKPWFAFLKLFIGALEKLPPKNGTIWRGVNGEVESVFDDGDVHTWWSINSCSVDTSVVKQYLDKGGTLFAIHAHHGRDISQYSAFQAEKEIVLMPGTRLRAKSHSQNFDNYFFLINLEEEEADNSKSQTEQNYLFGSIRQEYQQNNRIQRIMNTSISFPIEQSYINLAIVETKEQKEKEKKLFDEKDSDEIISTYEQIYGTKTKIEIKDIFEKCTEPTKNILVLGQAGIGKTTFCRYVVHQWATGTIWQQYQLVIFIRLRNLTEDRYPPLAANNRYSLIQVVKTEYFCDGLSQNDERLLKEQLEKSRVLWLLNGYDEIVQNTSVHLQHLLEQLLKTPHHILTSRPYMNTLSYNVQLEITGFTDDNIKEYVELFFDQTTDEKDNSSHQPGKLVNFLKFNPRIWGIAHIPVNLELICSLWSNTDWTETTKLTMTTLYDKMTEWLCRRHLERQTSVRLQIRKNAIYKRSYKELAFLETLAFHGMRENTVILRPKLLKKAEDETEYSLDDDPQLLNVGILKSFDDRPIGTDIEAEKNHYFIHLSFQEHFAARYLVRALKGNATQQKIATDFIKKQKYNQRFELVFSFVSGLTNNDEDQDCIKLFWDTLLSEPVDLIGIRHVQLVIACMEETECNKSIPRFCELLNLIIKCITYSISNVHHCLHKHVKSSLERSPSLVNQREILDIFRKLYNDNDAWTKEIVYCMISYLPISNSKFDLIGLHLAAINDQNTRIQQIAYQALAKMGEQAATDQIINALVNSLGNTDPYIRHNACQVFKSMGEKAITGDVIKRLVSLLENPNYYAREAACELLGDLGEKAATSEVIRGLTNALRDTSDSVRRSASRAFNNIGEKAATDEAINGLVGVLEDADILVRWKSCEALGKMGEKAANNLVISNLLNALRDANEYVRNNAREALRTLSEKITTNDVIYTFVIALNDTNEEIRQTADKIVHKMAENETINQLIRSFQNELQHANTPRRWDVDKSIWTLSENKIPDEVIDGLVSVLSDPCSDVIEGTRETPTDIDEKLPTDIDEKLPTDIDEKPPTDKVINELLGALRDTDSRVRCTACQTLQSFGKNAATNEIVNHLLFTLGDTESDVRQAAWQAIQSFRGKIATKELINTLLNVLDNTNPIVRRKAWETLGSLGNIAATSKVVNRLVSAFSDKDHNVRQTVLKALRNFGEKALTNEVINGLVSSLRDTDFQVRRDACIALENIGERADTTEVINGLVSVLTDADSNVRCAACKSIWRIGKRASTTEVINGLVNALTDTDSEVRSHALDALRSIGAKAVTNEVINRLMSLLRHNNSQVRRVACEALGNTSEELGTKEVINRLVSVLRDTNPNVREDACNALKNFGEKSATNEVINGLLRVLKDTDPGVRQAACKSIGSIGKSSTNSEVINGLASALRNTDPNRKIAACEAISSIGERAGVTEVINELVSALKSTNWNVISAVCGAISSIGERAGTTEVINELVSVLKSTNWNVISAACEAISSIGERAGVTEVINGLVNALKSTNADVISAACRAISSIGERAGTTEVINELVSVLKSTNADVVRAAYGAISGIGKRASTTEVINAIVGVLENANSYVRFQACVVVQNLGEKVATNEVINRLIGVLGDADLKVRSKALKVLESFGEKTTSNKVITRLIKMCNGNDTDAQNGAIKMCELILPLLTCMSHFDDLTVKQLSLCIHQFSQSFLKTVSPLNFIKAFLDTKILFWLPIIKKNFVLTGYPVTIAEDTVMLYGSNEPVELYFVDRELGQQLKDTLVNWMDEKF